MNNFIDVLNFSIAVSGCLLAFLGLFLSLSFTSLQKGIRKFLICIFTTIMAYVFSDLVSQISLVFLGPGYASLSKLAVFLESFFSSVLMPLLTLFMLYINREDWRKSRLLYASAILWLIYFLLLIITQMTHFIYFISDKNVYFRGSWYPLLLVSPILLMLMNLSALFRRRNQLSVFQRRAFFFYLCLPLIGMLIQSFSYGLLVVVLSTVLSSLFLLYFILRDQKEQHLRLVEINSRQQMDILLLQMRPHFIYNTLSSIYYLCEIDPLKAQQTIGNFTTYLRKNFTAVAKHDLIPFSEELEHTKAYLAVEQTRYDDLLTVDYDIRKTDFRLPPLTLQPIVENAVKHGVDPELVPLLITIRTIESEKGILISVEDSGPGYSPEKDDEIHVGIQNIRRRLQLMCGASLEIRPGNVRGTVVVIRIPRFAQQDD